MAKKKNSSDSKKAAGSGRKKVRSSWVLGPGPTPLERAQELIYQAFEASGVRQEELARQALEISPDCADAYSLLAEHAQSPREARELYEQAVAAGERALGKTTFEEYVGHFWGLMETRPYMRARAGLANCLWEEGRIDEAAEHYREMLRLNPNDNQGVRYSLAALLLDIGRDAELRELLKRYKDDATADWQFTHTLAAFREQGDSSHARKFLVEAAKQNPHVADYLLGDKPLPHDLPPYVTLGGDTEAAAYAVGNRRAWLNTPGAVSWLRAALNVPLPQPHKAKRAAWPELRLALRRLPQNPDEIWQVDEIGVESESTIWVIDRTNERPLAWETIDGAPAPRDALTCLTNAMRQPIDREPRRPARIEVRRPAYHKAWNKKLAEIDVECELVDRLDLIDAIVAEIPAIAERDSETVQFTGDLLALPQQIDEVWQADLRKSPAWVTGEGQPYRAWLCIVLDASERIVLAHRLTPERPSIRELWEVVNEAIRQPMAGEPRRPSRIEVASQEVADELAPQFREAEIGCTVSERLEGVEAALDSMAEFMDSPTMLPSLFQSPGMQPAQVGSFYAAAADFYRARPWRQAPGDTPIQIECDKFQSGPWYAVVMGQSGIQQGVALYEDLAALQLMIAGDGTEEANARGMSALSLMYSEAFELPVRDLDAAEQHGWPVAGPEAYPLVMRINPGMATRPPLVWELELLEGCLRAIPEFIARKKAAASLTAATGAGAVVAVELGRGRLGSLIRESNCLSQLLARRKQRY